MLEQDLVMRDIETLTLSLSRFVFGKDSTNYESDGDEIWDGQAMQLDAMVGRGELNEAEDFLFDAMEDGDDRALELAVDFYARINTFTDGQLKESGFTRQEVSDGLHEAMDRFGVVLP